MANCTVFGLQIGYARFSGDITGSLNPTMLMDDLKELKPTIFGSFPLFYNKIYRNVMYRISQESELFQSIFNKALETKL